MEPDPLACLNAIISATYLHFTHAHGNVATASPKSMIALAQLGELGIEACRLRAQLEASEPGSVGPIGEQAHALYERAAKRGHLHAVGE